MDVFTKVINKIPQIFERRVVRYGVPFFILIVGGSFGLKEFAQLRYTFAKQQKLSREDVEKLGVKMKVKEEVTVDAVYGDIQQVDIDNWKNIRGPRPWEETSPELVEMRNKNKRLGQPN